MREAMGWGDGVMGNGGDGVVEATPGIDIVALSRQAASREML
jgi:hypothetical protein